MAKHSAAMIAKSQSAVLAVSLVAVPTRQLYGETTPLGSYVLNFPPDSPEAAELVFLAEESATREWHQHTETGFPVKWWVAKAIELPNLESGEVVRQVRLVLISPEKETLSFVSIGAAASLDLIRSIFGDGPYEPALALVVRPDKTRSGFNLLRLRPEVMPSRVASKSV